MKENSFKDEDKEKVIEFLNFLAQHAKFDDLNIEKIIKFFKLLSYLQTQIIPKINDHILEIKKVHEPTDSKVDDDIL